MFTWILLGTIIMAYKRFKYSHFKQVVYLSNCQKVNKNKASN